LKKRGPKTLLMAALRLIGVKVFFNQSEAEDLDSRRGSWSRAEFIRAAALGAELAAPLSAAYADTFQQSARIQADLTQLNQHCRVLNQLRLSGGEQEAAIHLLKLLPEISRLLAEFRASLPDAKSQKRKAAN
jgi:anti-sigma-K factor RskA